MTEANNNQHDYIPRLAAWACFAWGVCQLFWMIHYGRLYLANPAANEMGIGLTMAFVYGAVPWVGCIVYALSAWRTSPWWERALLLLLPMTAAAIFFGVASTR